MEKRRGMPLVEAIYEKAREIGLDNEKIPELLGYTDSYWSVIARGGRWIGTVGFEKLEVIARFIEKPLVTVYVLARIFEAEDFVAAPSKKEIFARAYEQMKSHPELQIFVPTQEIWDAAAEEMKLLCVYMSARVINEELIDLSSPGWANARAVTKQL